jgi:hypothetical protein
VARHSSGVIASNAALAGLTTGDYTSVWIFLDSSDPSGTRLRCGELQASGAIMANIGAKEKKFGFKR